MIEKYRNCFEKSRKIVSLCTTLLTILPPQKRRLDQYLATKRNVQHLLLKTPEIIADV